MRRGEGRTLASRRCAVLCQGAAFVRPALHSEAAAGWCDDGYGPDDKCRLSSYPGRTRLSAAAYMVRLLVERGLNVRLVQRICRRGAAERS